NFDRNACTSGADHRAMSSGVGVECRIWLGIVPAVMPYGVWYGATGSGDVAGGPHAGGGAVLCAVRAGIWLMSPAITASNAAALGNRFAGSFSSSIMMAADKSGGTSGLTWSSGAGRSEMCFMSIAAVLDA